MFRVQMNTLELLIVFLPALFVAANYWSAYIVAGLGAVYIVGRTLYWRGYIADPSKRGTGFLLSMIPTMLLALLALAGILLALSGF